MCRKMGGEFFNLSIELRYRALSMNNHVSRVMRPLQEILSYLTLPPPTPLGKGRSYAPRHFVMRLNAWKMCRCYIRMFFRSGRGSIAWNCLVDVRVGDSILACRSHGSTKVMELVCGSQCLFGNIYVEGAATMGRDVTVRGLRSLIRRVRLSFVPLGRKRYSDVGTAAGLGVADWHYGE